MTRDGTKDESLRSLITVSRESLIAIVCFPLNEQEIAQKEQSANKIRTQNLLFISIKFFILQYE